MLENVIAFAEEHSVRELTEHCRLLRNGEPTKSSHQRMMFTVTRSGEAMIRQALDLVRRRSGKPDLSDGFALGLYSAEWLMGEGDTTLDESIAALEARHGVRLTISAPTDN